MFVVSPILFSLIPPPICLSTGVPALPLCASEAEKGTIPHILPGIRFTCKLYANIWDFLSLQQLSEPGFTGLRII